MLSMRVAMVLKEDGLNLEWVKEDMKNRGIKILEIQDDEYIEDHEKVKLLYLDGSFGAMTRLKLDYNCWTQMDNQYIWYPMENLTSEDWAKYMKMKADYAAGSPG